MSFKKGVAAAHSQVDETGPRDKGALKTGGRCETRAEAQGLGRTVRAQTWADGMFGGTEERPSRLLCFLSEKSKAGSEERCWEKRGQTSDKGQQKCQG